MNIDLEKHPKRLFFDFEKKLSNSFTKFDENCNGFRIENNNAKQRTDKKWMKEIADFQKCSSLLLLYLK